MKKIRLNSVYYFSWGGLTLTSENPSAEANEALIEKMKPYISNGYLKVVDSENEFEEIVENTIENCIGDNDGNIFDSIPDFKEVEVKTERIPLPTKDELKEKSKKELLQMAKDMGLKYPKNVTVDALVEAIFENL